MGINESMHTSHDPLVVGTPLAEDASKEALGAEYKKTVVDTKNQATQLHKNIMSFFAGVALTALTTTTAFSQESAATLQEPEPARTEKVMMPDGTIFYVTKEEYKELADFEQSLAEGAFDTKEEMYDAYKEVIEDTRKQVALENELAELDTEEQNIDKEITQNKAESETQIQQLKQDIAQLEKQQQENREKDLGRKVSLEESKRLSGEMMRRKESFDADEKTFLAIQQKTQNTGSLALADQTMLQSMLKKWQNYKGNIPSITNINAVFCSTLHDFLQKHIKEGKVATK